MMVWVVAGLICSSTACIWYTPVGDRTYETEERCTYSIAVDATEDLLKFRLGSSPYKALKCRRTEQRRME